MLSEAQRLPKQDVTIWDGVKNSVAVLLRNGVPISQAALIDKSGMFLANQSAVSTAKVQARLGNGKVVTLDWKATDIPTQTVLLQAEDWKPEDGTVVTLHQNGESVDNAKVLVVLPSGPVLGDHVAGNRIGYLSSSKRAFQLGEVRFEANTESVAGALVFDEKGHLLGLLNATLGSQIVRVRANNPPSSALFPRTSQGQSSGGARAGGYDSGQYQQKSVAKADPVGPADVTTGYTVGPDILRRVVAGFLSPSHKVLHPAIGVSCKDGPTPGALVIAVTPGSPAEKAGIQVGDTIVRMDEKPIQTQIEFSLVIQGKDVGDSLTVVVMRDFVAHTFKLTVGTNQKVLVAPLIGAVGPVGS